MMKKIAAGFTLLILSMFANAGMWVWHVEATSPSASGWGEHVSYNVASSMAMANCVARTPSYQVCYITFKDQFYVH